MNAPFELRTLERYCRLVVDQLAALEAENLASFIDLQEQRAAIEASADFSKLPPQSVTEAHRLLTQAMEQDVLVMRKLRVARERLKLMIENEPHSRAATLAYLMAAHSGTRVDVRS